MSGTDKDLESLIYDRLKNTEDKSHLFSQVLEKDEKVDSYLGTPKEFELEDNELYFSEVFGWEPTTIPDIPVPFYDKEYWAEEVRHLIPERDTDYHLDAETIEEVMYGMYSKGTLLLYGPTGTGKTSIAKEIAAQCCMPFLRVSGHGQMEVSELLGSTQVTTDPVSNTPITKHCDTDVTLAVKHGGLLVLDEVFRIPSHCLMALQSTFEYPHVLNLQDAQGVSRNLAAPIHDFKLVLTDNTNGTGDTSGKFTAEIQDVSTLNRIRRSVYIDYLKPDEEIELVQKQFKDMPKFFIDKMVKVAGLARTGFTTNKLEQTISIRELLSWGQSIEDLRNIGQAFRYAVYNSAQDTDKEVLADIYRQVFGETIDK